MTSLPLWVKRRSAKSENLPTQEKVILRTHPSNVVLKFTEFQPQSGTEFPIYAGGVGSIAVSGRLEAVQVGRRACVQSAMIDDVLRSCRPLLSS